MNAAGSRWDGPCKWKITGKNPSLPHMRENLRSRTVLPAPRRPHTATFPALPPLRRLSKRANSPVSAPLPAKCGGSSPAPGLNGLPSCTSPRERGRV